MKGALILEFGNCNYQCSWGYSFAVLNLTLICTLVFLGKRDSSRQVEVCAHGPGTNRLRWLV